jgi:hypothetical protein
MQSPLGGDSRAKRSLDPPVEGAGNMDLTSQEADRDKGANTMTSELTGVIADYVAAVNAFDIDAIVATFAEDAYINDNRREITGSESIRRFVAKEFVGDRVTMDVREVLDHYGDTIVRAKFDGTYDKTNLPEELIMSSYLSVRENRIVSLAVIFNQPSGY